MNKPAKAAVGGLLGLGAYLGVKSALIETNTREIMAIHEVNARNIDKTANYPVPDVGTLPGGDEFIHAIEAIKLSIKAIIDRNRLESEAVRRYLENAETLENLIKIARGRTLTAAELAQLIVTYNNVEPARIALSNGERHSQDLGVAGAMEAVQSQVGHLINNHLTKH